ncbi:MAG: double-strand break repair helicase AddA [Alphaproteobacteria bacterium]
MTSAAHATSTLAAPANLDAIREEAFERQRRAADPTVSAWVSANAGTGKTHVLVQRVLRLLLSGAPASSILCLTFTKAAAAEMSNRLIRELGRWAALPDDALAAELAKILERPPLPDELAFARCLFAAVLDAPGGLKIMTIHAFCDRVLRRFPLEAGVPPSFTIFTDEKRDAALREAIDTVLNEAADDTNGTLGKALQIAVAHAGEDAFAGLLNRALGEREHLAALIRSQIDANDMFAGIERTLRMALGVGADDTPTSLQRQMAAVLSDTQVTHAVEALSAGAKTDQNTSAALARARGAAGDVRIEAFTAAFLTAKGDPRKRLFTKAIREAHPSLADALEAARDAFSALTVKLRATHIAIATAALLLLADAVMRRYDEASSDAGAWVLYRLDADLTHILVDEAQDTSPAQWALVNALTDEFFTGEGADERPRTLFAVGDEKQSIYSFQGAEPRRFAEAGRDFSGRARAAGDAWHQAPLTLSFRSTRAVLGAVDLVFADPTRTPGLSADAAAASAAKVRHDAHRAEDGGLVELWDPEIPDEHDSVSAWEPFAEEAGAPPPAVQLANRIARQIRHWLDVGEILVSKNRPVRAGDILILVKKRNPFAAPMVKALKDHGIPVAGADRLRLTEQLAVMDLMVLGDAVLLPQDDLSLATLLKSPAFTFTDDDLFAIGYDRPGTLWTALLTRADDGDARAAEAVSRLERWREEAANAKPFEFYMARLENDGLRNALISRLGPEAADAIAEFLNLALQYEASAAPTLQGFLHWLRISAPEIKRDMEQARDEVRIMTVHGAKGLEANIVFMADTCSTSAAKRGGLILLNAEFPLSHGAQLPIWALPGAAQVPQIEAAHEAIQTTEREEYHRLLYVAMTRARDRLYVAGFEGKNGRNKGCWYDLVAEGLSEHLRTAEDAFGNRVQRMETPQLSAPAEAAKVELSAPDAISPLPDWISRPVRQEQTPARAVNPSRLRDGRAVKAGDAISGDNDAAPREDALLRGILVHRLLELLPALPPAKREQAGRRFLSTEGATLSPGISETLLGDVCRILETPNFAAVFGPGSRAEVPLAVEMPGVTAREPLFISGQIDRLIVGESEIVAVDFKTGGFIPKKLELVPAAYITQLAAYRLALTRLFPGKTVRAAILWTQRPLFMEIPAATLDAAGITILQKQYDATP